MLARNRIEKDALAYAAQQEGRRERALAAAATASRSCYVVQISGASVRHTREVLERHGFESWYPQVLKAHPVPRKKLSHAQRRHAAAFREFRPEPLFRNYLFVWVDLASDHWHVPFREAGAYGISCEGDVPCKLRAEDVERIRAKEIDGAIPAETPVREMFAVGDACRMTSGPFADFTGIIDQVDESGRVRLLLHLFGRPTNVTPEFSDFEKIEPPPD